MLYVIAAYARAQLKAAAEAEAPSKSMHAASVSGSRCVSRARQGGTESAAGRDKMGNKLEAHLPNACMTSSQAVRRLMRSSSSTGAAVPTTRVN